jgi:hypothetical protein
VEWSLLIGVPASAAAGLALGPVVTRRLRRLLLVAGLEAALLGVALRWLSARPDLLPLEGVPAGPLGLGLLALAALLAAFVAGAAWTGP